MYPDIFESATFSLRIRLPSTRIRWIQQQTNPQLSESALQRGNFWIRYNSGIVWTLSLNCHTSPSPITGRGRGEEWPDGLGGGDVRHFRLVGAKSEYFLYSYVQASSLPWIFKTVPCATLSLLYLLHFSFKSYNVCAVKPTIRDSSSLRGRRLEGKGKGVLGARETRRLGRARRREGNACQETIVFLVFNIHQANVKILIGQSSKHVNHSLNTLIRLVEINITLLSNLIDLSVII